MPCLWGNPFSTVDGKREEANRNVRVGRYRAWLLSQPEMVGKARAELRGKVLACWCAPRECHGHVLAAVANCSDDELREMQCAPCGRLQSAQYVS